MNRKQEVELPQRYILVAHPYPTSLPGGTGQRRLGVHGRALVSECSEHWTIQP